MNFNLIETIEIVKKNKKCFNSQEDYLKIITNLYNEISEKNLLKSNLNKEPKFNEEILEEMNDNLKLSNYNKDEEKILFNKILETFTFIDILKIKNFDKLSLNNQLFDLFFIENELMKFNPDINYHIQTELIIDKYDKEYLMKFIKVLLYLCEKAYGTNNKTLIVIIIYDTLFKNFQFVLDNNNFALTVKNKLKELELQKDYFNQIIEKYKFEKNFLEKWIEIFENIN